MDFVAQRLPDGRWIRVPTVVDQFTRECLTLFAENALSGEKVAKRSGQGAPESIAVDKGTEFASKAMDLWAYKNGVHLYFIRPGRPVENGYIESFNGRLRNECLNVEVFFTLGDARRNCTSGGGTTTTTTRTLPWRTEPRQSSPPAAAQRRRRSRLGKRCAFPTSLRTTTTGIIGKITTLNPVA